MTDPPVTSTELLRPWLARQYAELTGALLRLEEPEQVHRARVRARRIRSVLAAYADVVPAEARRLRPRLRRLARALSDLRDVDVLTELLVGDSEPHGAAHAWAEALHQQRTDLLAPAQREAGRKRTRRLLRHLHRLCAPEAWQHLPTTPAIAVAERVPRDQLDRVRSREESGTRHDVRKAAKQLRYAAELAATVHPPAAETAEVAQRIQDDLGADLDELMAAAWLDDFAARTANPQLADASRAEAARRRRPAAPHGG
ncbi:CHAD domain-containing protein [Nocardioides sp.]|uniref:CHAD domain-containing protein n=1 Tax=Nocardioides sp. TaxID=35761 RepID=UPI002734EFA1|nr:CHAD domain-containing protein [Nocardioides sp.]MDP3893111.1 CHAD domain-containing protein [Nocardioides sp.]